MKYLFDTDILSNLMKKQPSPNLLEKLKELSPNLQCTSTITVGELYYGACRLHSPASIIERIEKEIFPSLYEILPFDKESAKEYGRIRAKLEGKGESLSEPDLRIAAICLVNNATLVTGNIKHFARIDGLKVEDWLL
ncbi:MAG: type II toxin-antitoxin system VapC family toxin [bacterium]